MNKRGKSALVGVAALVIITSTWAFFNSESRIENKLHTKEYGAETIEKFKPDQELEPGTAITKEVGVKNTGDYDLVVRVKLEEEWTRGDDSFIAFASVDNDGTFNKEIISATKTDDEKVTAIQGDDNDGLVEDDQTVMYKNLLGVESGKWTQGADGWFYYAATLKAGDTTELLLDTLKLAGNTDMGKYEVVQKYSKTAISEIESLEAAYNTAKADYLVDQDDADKKAAMDTARTELEDAYEWTKEKPESKDITYQKMESILNANAKGYASAEYTLTIVTQVCQATAEAVSTIWPAIDENVVAAWELQ